MTPTLQIEGRPGGPIVTVSYRLADVASGQWALIDPTFDVLTTWADWLDGRHPPQAILITHGHFDHVAGVAEVVLQHPGVEVWTHPDGARLLEDPNLNGATLFGFPYQPCRATHTWREGDDFALGQSPLRVIETPGHCPGSVVLLAEGMLIGGDILFRGGVGRWDLPGADYATLSRTIREKIMTLPDETVVYPGHGPATTIGEERRNNEIVHAMLAGEQP
jgi:hydroxyacylglutathione hydrolase